MSDADPTALPAAAPSARGGSPEAGLADLPFRPRRFYARPPAWLGHPAALPALALVGGMATAIGRIDQTMLRDDLGRPRPGEGAFADLLAGAWPVYWGVVLVSGVMSAVLIWHVGAWWYRVRLRWSGAPGVDAESAREVFLPSLLVRSAPSVLVMLGATARHADFGAYWAAPAGAVDFLVLVFPFWGTWIAYRGVRARFPVARGRARAWFLVLPALFYFVALGVIGAVGALAADG
ncbi:hypothetical protein [Roseisolibacter sp. H3M3-2]|uniref:hypothetical protein n=1 Tax=Roseisolibacter sp. H3M3-2 TaxID=3031323 RepID=UPI0023D9D8DA|nr:hypothetical protein [Roseisolibacter sp. H3M3-2]MDF1503788.1 hypothetical protein [Roseisolibacter sp. H3M3-2]